MNNKSTFLFGASLVTALGAIAIDYTISEAPKPLLAHEESFNPCAAAIPAKIGQRNYDDLAEDYSGSAVAPAPLPAPSQENSNPCSAGVL